MMLLARGLIPMDLGVGREMNLAWPDLPLLADLAPSAVPSPSPTRSRVLRLQGPGAARPLAGSKGKREVNQRQPHTEHGARTSAVPQRTVTRRSVSTDTNATRVSLSECAH